MSYLKNRYVRIVISIIVAVIIIIFLEGIDIAKYDFKAKNNVETASAEVMPEPAQVHVKTIYEPEILKLGKFKLTAYCSCEKCCGKYAKHRPVNKTGKEIVYTASGAVAKEGITIAADTKLYPYGTVLIIDGQEYTVQDCGGMIKGNCIDIYFNNHQEALDFGVQHEDVYMKVDMNNG